MTTIALLFASNVFMTAAWYGHLRFKTAPVWAAILVTAAQLKIAQEVITLVVFVVFAWLWLGEIPRWNEAVAFALVLLAVAVVSLR